MSIQPPSQPVERFIFLADTALSVSRDGPRRYAENPSHGAMCALLGKVFCAPSDEAIQARFAWLKTVSKQRLFFRIVGLLNIVRHYRQLRRANIIYCRAPHYFWWLLLLNRWGLFPTDQKKIFVIYYLSESFLRRLAWWREAPLAFNAFFVSRDQIAELELHGCPPRRQRYLPFRIDTEWFSPAEKGAGSYLLVAGDIHRDERLVIKLNKSSPLPIVRIGRSARLRDLYRDTNIKLVLNATHTRYREYLRDAAGVLLPIEPCNEPAGLTALLEAFACKIPVIANASMEVGTLFERAIGAKPLADLQPETWLTAIHTLLAGESTSSELRQRGRDYVAAHHSIPPANEEWLPLLNSFAGPLAQ